MLYLLFTGSVYITILSSEFQYAYFVLYNITVSILLQNLSHSNHCLKVLFCFISQGSSIINLACFTYNLPFKTICLTAIFVILFLNTVVKMLMLYILLTTISLVIMFNWLWFSIFVNTLHISTQLCSLQCIYTYGTLSLVFYNNLYIDAIMSLYMNLRSLYTCFIVFNTLYIKNVWYSFFTLDR